MRLLLLTLPHAHVALVNHAYSSPFSFTTSWYWRIICLMRVANLSMIFSLASITMRFSAKLKLIPNNPNVFAPFSWPDVSFLLHFSRDGTDVPPPTSWPWRVASPSASFSGTPSNSSILWHFRLMTEGARFMILAMSACLKSNFMR